MGFQAPGAFERVEGNREKPQGAAILCASFHYCMEHLEWFTLARSRCWRGSCCVLESPSTCRSNLDSVHCRNKYIAQAGSEKCSASSQATDCAVLQTASERKFSK